MQSQKISRRQALKLILAVAGGLIGIAFLPSKWTKPVDKNGALPVRPRNSSSLK
jgi:hypothetical protein